MTPVGQPERATQHRVIALFHDELRYRYLGDWTDRDGNANIEEGPLSAWLTERGYTPAQISIVLHKLRTEADNHSRTLYGNNQAVYTLLRYGVPVKIEEQESIVEVLDDMDAEIASLEAKLVKARQVKQGMMQELLTGRIRLV